MMPVPFSPFRTKSRGFDPYAETPDGQSQPNSPPLSPTGDGGAAPQEEHDLKPPEPPQLVLPSLLSRRMNSIVQVQVSYIAQHGTAQHSRLFLV